MSGCGERHAPEQRAAGRILRLFSATTSGLYFHMIDSPAVIAWFESMDATDWLFQNRMQILRADDVVIGSVGYFVCNGLAINGV